MVFFTIVFFFSFLYSFYYVYDRLVTLFSFLFTVSPVYLYNLNWLQCSLVWFISKCIMVIFKIIVIFRVGCHSVWSNNTFYFMGNFSERICNTYALIMWNWGKIWKNIVIEQYRHAKLPFFWADILSTLHEIF